MKISIHMWDKVNLDLVARLTYTVRGGHWTGSSAIQEIVGWLQNEFAARPRLAVLAHAEDALVGWLMLVIGDAGTAEINPWQLGGHPIVAPDRDARTVGAQLLQAATHWAGEKDLRRLTLAAPMPGGEADPEQEAWYRAQGFDVQLRYVEMRCYLSEQAIPAVQIPPGLSVKLLRAASEEALYACYYDAFENGDARFFLAQDEPERKAYFDTLGLPEAQDEPASLILTNDQRLIGFTYVLPYGAGNRHISCMCVHPDFQGRGLGKLLLQLIMRQAIKDGHQTLTLGTETEMRAFELYRKHGFEITEGSVIYAWQRAG